MRYRCNSTPIHMTRKQSNARSHVYSSLEHFACCVGPHSAMSNLGHKCIPPRNRLRSLPRLHESALLQTHPAAVHASCREHVSGNICLCNASICTEAHKTSCGVLQYMDPPNLDSRRSRGGIGEELECYVCAIRLLPSNVSQLAHRCDAIRRYGAHR